MKLGIVSNAVGEFTGNVSGSEENRMGGIMSGNMHHGDAVGASVDSEEIVPSHYNRVLGKKGVCVSH